MDSMDPPPVVVRVVRFEHGQPLVSIPRDLAKRWGLRPGDYVAIAPNGLDTATLWKLRPKPPNPHPPSDPP